MNNKELRNDVLAKLQCSGFDISEKAKTPEIIAAITAITGRVCGWHEQTTDFLMTYLKPSKATVHVAKFKPKRAHIHPRAAEIDAAQPATQTQHCVGNGNERTKIWTR